MQWCVSLFVRALRRVSCEDLKFGVSVNILTILSGTTTTTTTTTTTNLHCPGHRDRDPAQPRLRAA
jgi:hypothetical protein